MEQRCFNDFSVSIYRLWYKKFLTTVIKIRKPNVQLPLPREQRIIMVTRSGDNPYLLSFTVSGSLLKLTSIESVNPS